MDIRNTNLNDSSKTRAIIWGYGWSLLGLGIPGAVALLVIPSLINNIGLERFGVLGLAWTITSIGGILDLGMGRAGVYFISRHMRHNAAEAISRSISTISQISFMAGLVTGLVLLIAELTGIKDLMNFDDLMQQEITAAIFLLAFTMPIQTLSSGLRGINEAFGQFRAIAFIRTINGVVTFLLPLFISFYTVNITALVAPILLSRGLVCLSLYMATSKYLEYNSLKPMPKQLIISNFNFNEAKKIISFGAWTSISSVISPIMTQGDRFYIGAAISMTAVGIYTIAQELIGQSLMLVGALGTVVFPLLSKVSGEDKTQSRKTVTNFAFVALPVFLIVYGAIFLLVPIFFQLWMPEVDSTVVTVVRILCVGAFFNSLASLPFAALQANGRADLTAKIHLLEMPVFLALLILLVSQFSLIGAAIAWTCRATIDCFLLSISYAWLREGPHGENVNATD